MGIPTFIKKKHIVLILTGLVLLGAILRIYILLISNNRWGSDPTSRVMVAMEWLKRPSLIPPHIDWLPLHFYLMGIGLKILNAPLFTPRLISLIFGILSFIPFYKLVNMIFGRRLALMSLWLLIFYPVHVLCSVVSLSEIIFLFFLLCGLYFFFRYREIFNSYLLLVSSLFLILASIVRYEAWLFVLFIPFLLCYEKRKRWRDMIFFFIATSIFPLIWIFNTNAIAYKQRFRSEEHTSELHSH